MLPRDIKPIEVTSGVPNNFKLQSTEFLREESCHLEKKLDFGPFGNLLGSPSSLMFRPQSYRAL